MKIILEEKQKFNQLLIWLPLIGLLIFVVFNYFKNSLTSNLIPVLIVGILILFFLSITLKYSIFEQEIVISYFPFFKKKIFKKDEISEISIVTYNPLLDFGGWGVRYGKSGTTAYNIKGKTGIFVALKNGKRYLIGTQISKDILREKLKLFFDEIEERKF
ncbi:hypothetical protein [Chryseobacterium sp. MMS23-Vi53]|uniref:hypothetical protein n=1 Tax=Chryseobacterium sp. MMS23-Vi53 TaxID=3386644 RepID=UPI0039ED840F